VRLITRGGYNWDPDSVQRQWWLVGGGSEKNEIRAERQWGRPVRRKSERPLPNCFQLPCPKSTALQSDSTIISKKSDGCIDTHHKGRFRLMQSNGVLCMV
jgi:hypothetical protein